MRRLVGLLLTAIAACACDALAEKGGAKVAFPRERPERGCFPRPHRDERLDISPPGFCWWAAGERGKVKYRLKVFNEKGALAYQSPLLTDPAHVPDRVFPQGRYTWKVEALDGKGNVLDEFPARRFTIVEGAFPQPWVSPAKLLKRVPKGHPRLLFTRENLEAVRATLDTSRREAFRDLKRRASRALRLKPPPEPDYDRIEDKAQQRMAYKHSFAEMRRYHQGGMMPLALMYLLTGEEKYAEVAKKILLAATEWDVEGISSVLSPYGDEIGLGLARSEAYTYDWLHDYLTDSEREKVKRMLIARADQLLRRLQKHDFLVRPENSHDGRLPGYLVEHAIALAEEPRARVWMDYAMRVLLTVYPHWAGKDGGWAEGVPYGLAYNIIYLAPFESLYRATGFDLWRRPFYRKVRYFFLYNISPRGELMPFGDTEDAAVAPRAPLIRALMQFHASKYRDSTVRWWMDLFVRDGRKVAGTAAFPGIILPDDVEPKEPENLPQDAAFFGVGWAALHSDIMHPEKDLMVMFKSSPYGSVSHSHADQNCFVIMKGGKALAIPAGRRYPIHGSPFHVKYTQQTLAHNAILVNGEGQVNRNGNANGRLVSFKTGKHFGYVCGDAARAYGGLLKKFRRHVLLLRPFLVVVVDDLEAKEPSKFQWLLHAKEKFSLDEGRQVILSRRGGAEMTVQLFTRGGFAFSQTNEWTVSPREGFPKTREKLPEKQWHFTAETRGKSTRRRIAAVMAVKDGAEKPTWEAKYARGVVVVKASAGDVRAEIRIDLRAEKVGTEPVITLNARVGDGHTETLSVK